MRVAILGTGNVGSALSERLRSGGHEVTVGSRTPDPEAGTVSQADAVTAGDVVIVAIPGTAVLSTLEAIGEETLGDRVILDLSVAFTPEMTLAYPNDSVARQIQARFPDTRVVKTLNTMNVSIMIDPLASVPQATVMLSGDDAEAKATVAGLLHDFGWTDEDILDLGDVNTAAATEHLALLFLATFAALRTPKFSIAIAH